jgi:hypothetical protein
MIDITSRQPAVYAVPAIGAGSRQPFARGWIGEHFHPPGEHPTLARAADKHKAEPLVETESGR